MGVLGDVFAANPLAQAVGLVAFGLGILTFSQRNDQRLRIFLTAFCAVIGAHFFLLGAPAGAYAAWLSGVRSYVSIYTRHVAVMGFFLLLIWVTTIPNIIRPLQWLAVIGATLGTWALYRERGIRMRAIILAATACWLVHNIAVGSIGGALIESCFLLVNSHTIFRLWRVHSK
ncbi:MAG: YgjV family protein [Candidatus Competibacter sp.]|nr:YgjV family protein [Candidatus Competibacter sp.]